MPKFLGGPRSSSGSPGTSSGVAGVPPSVIAAALPATYFVDPVSGSNGNAGTLAAPWQTAAYAVARSLNNGDTILFKKFVPGGAFRDAFTVVAGKQINYGTYGTGADTHGGGRANYAVFDHTYDLTAGPWVSQDPVDLGTGNLYGVFKTTAQIASAFNATRTISDTVLTAVAVDLTALGPTPTFYVSCGISGTGIAAGTAIVSYTATTITLSVAATSSGTNSVTIGSTPAHAWLLGGITRPANQGECTPVAGQLQDMALDARWWTLDFNSQTVNFSVGNSVIGATSGASARLLSQTDGGATGTFVLTNWNGIAYQNGEALNNGSTANGNANGTMSAQTSQWARAQGTGWKAQLITSDGRGPMLLSVGGATPKFASVSYDAMIEDGIGAWWGSIYGSSQASSQGLTTVFINTGSLTNDPQAVWGSAGGNVVFSAQAYRTGTSVYVFTGSRSVAPATLHSEILFGGRVSTSLTINGSAHGSRFDRLMFLGGGSGLATSSSTPCTDIDFHKVRIIGTNDQNQWLDGNHRWTIRGGAFKHNGVPGASAKSSVKIGSATSPVPYITGIRFLPDADNLGTDGSFAGEDGLSTQMAPGSTLYTEKFVAVFCGENGDDDKNYGHEHHVGAFFGCDMRSTGSGTGGTSVQGALTVLFEDGWLIGHRAGQAMKTSPATDVIARRMVILANGNDALSLSDTPTLGTRGGKTRVEASLIVAARQATGQFAASHKSSDLDLFHNTIANRSKANNSAVFSQVPTTGELKLDARLYNNLLWSEGASSASYMIGRGTIIDAVTVDAQNNIADYRGASTTWGRPSSDGALLTQTIWDGGITCQVDFDTQTGNYTVGDTITGGTSGFTAVLVLQNDAGATGTLYCKTWNGIYPKPGETITDAHTGSAKVAASTTIKFPFKLGTDSTITDPTRDWLPTNPWDSTPITEGQFGYVLADGCGDSLGDWTVDGNLYQIPYTAGGLETFTGTTNATTTLASTSVDMARYAGKQLYHSSLALGTMLLYTATGTSGAFLNPQATGSGSGVTIQVGATQGERLKIYRSAVLIGTCVVRNDNANGSLIVSRLTVAVANGDTFVGARGFAATASGSSSAAGKLRIVEFDARSADFVQPCTTLTVSAAFRGYLVRFVGAGTSAGYLVYLVPTGTTAIADNDVVTDGTGSVTVNGTVKTSLARATVPSLEPPILADLNKTKYQNISGAARKRIDLASASRLKYTAATKLLQIRNAGDSAAGSASFASSSVGSFVAGDWITTNLWNATYDGVRYTVAKGVETGTGTLTNASNSITGWTGVDLTDYIGGLISSASTGIPAGTTITAYSAGTITLSASVTGMSVSPTTQTLTTGIDQLILVEAAFGNANVASSAGTGSLGQVVHLGPVSPGCYMNA